MVKSVKILLVAGAFCFFTLPLSACSPTSLRAIYTQPARGTLVVADTEPRQVVVIAVNRNGDETDVTSLSSFSSSDPKIVSVSAAGGAMGEYAGYANITVSYTQGKTTKIVVLPVTVVWSRGEGRAINW